METVAMQSPALAATESTTPPAAVAAPPPPTTPMLEISESAILRLRDVAAEQGVELVGVRVGVSGGGCSGLSYVLDFEKAPRLGDSVFGDNPKVFVDRKSLVFLRGTTLDFEGGLNGKGFVFKNPNAKASCGCGSSFSV
jgi:iron-sulfur cluster assembly protein